MPRPALPPNDVPAPPTAADPPELDRRLLAAQVQLLLDRTRASAWTNLSAALLLTALLWGRVAMPALLGWLALKVAVIAVRQWVRWRYRRRGGWDDAQWRRWFTAVVIVDGCIWGLAAVLFLPQVDGVIEALLLITLLAVVAIAAMVLPVHPPLHLGFSAGTLLPAALTELVSGGVVGLYGASACCCSRPSCCSRAAPRAATPTNCCGCACCSSTRRRRMRRPWHWPSATAPSRASSSRR